MRRMIRLVAVPLVALEKKVCKYISLEMSVTMVIVVGGIAGIDVMWATQVMRGGSFFLWSCVSVAECILLMSVVLEMNHIYQEQNRLLEE